MRRLPPRKTRTRLILGIALAGALALIVSGSILAFASRGVDARVQGTFNMHGTLTYVDNVYGEHQGQRVDRTWAFFPHCSTGVCQWLTLKRRRSNKQILDVTQLKRHGPGLYVGTGRFWVALYCAGRVVRYGGLATERITVQITRTQMVGSTRFATGISASYDNPPRTNNTRCPGGIGHDATRYSGRLASPLPGPPTASFTDTTNPATLTTTFTDESKPGRGGAPIVAWSWNFGDRYSTSNTSTQRNPTHRYGAPGPYTVTLHIRDRYGQTAATSAQVTVS